MNIEELQFKDKVNVMPEEKPATVFEINVINGSIKYYVDFLNHYNEALIQIVYPIYLNPQILLDNGFEDYGHRDLADEFVVKIESITKAQQTETKNAEA